MMQIDYNKFWSAAFDIIDDLIFILDKDFNLVKVNRHFLIFTGKNEKNIIGRKCYKLLHGKKKPFSGCPVLKMFETKKVECNEIYEPRLQKWFYTHITPIFDGEHELIGSVHIGHDISERKKIEIGLKNNEEYFWALSENSSDMVIVADKKGIIKFVSRSVERLMGYKPEELIGRNGFDFIVPTDFPRAIYDFRKAVKTTEGSIPNLFRVRHRDGSERILEGLGKNFLDNPIIAGFVMNVQDVTARKKAEQELCNLNHFCESIIDDANILIDVLDTQANVVIWNKAAEKTSGYLREETVGHNKIWTWLYPDDAYRKEIVAKVRAIIEKGEMVEGLETTIRCKIGEKKVISWNSRNLLNEKDEIIGSIAVGSDVSERKRVEEALRASEERFRRAINATGEGLWEWDILNDQEFFSPRWCEIIGYSFDDPELPHTYNSWAERIHPDDSERVISVLKDHLEKGTKYDVDYRHRHKSGEYRWQNSKGQAIFDERGKPTKMVGCIFDITERKKAGDGLRQSEERYRKQFEEAIDAIFLADPETGMIIDCNIAATKLVEREKSEIIGQHQSFLHPTKDIIDGVSKTFKSHVTGEAAELLEDRVITKSRQIKDVAIRASRITIKGKEVMQGIFRDITGQKQAEEKLRDSEEQLRAIFETAQDSIFIKDLSLKYIRVNPATKHFFGMPAAKLIGSSDEYIFGKKAARHIRKIDSRVLKGKIMEDEQTRLIRGVPTVVHMIKTPLYDNKGKISGLCGIVRDITERKKVEKELRDAYHKIKEAQQQLIQSGKMMAMGQLAAGISHEINQPLTGIKGFAQAVLTELDMNSPIREDIQNIVKQSDRIDRIISNVRLFAHKSDFKMEELDINKPIEDSLVLLSEQLRVHNIRLNKSLTPELPRIKADPNQLQQVFVNLITNARDAIDSLKSPGGGELTVKTSLSQDQKHIEVIFQDTGCGITKRNLTDIFNPFFTTKSHYTGMGMGLSIAHRIIESHKGKIEVASKQGKGTMFRIILPAVRIREKNKTNQDKKTKLNPAE